MRQTDSFVCDLYLIANQIGCSKNNANKLTNRDNLFPNCIAEITCRTFKILKMQRPQVRVAASFWRRALLMTCTNQHLWRASTDLDDHISHDRRNLPVARRHTAVHMIANHCKIATTVMGYRPRRLLKALSSAKRTTRYHLVKANKRVITNALLQFTVKMPDIVPSSPWWR